MKKILYILTICLLTGLAVQAQDDGADDRIRDKMREYIQKRLDLTKNESEKFAPVFIRYFKEWRTALRDNKGDRLVLQQKIIELKLKYRPEFKEILGEKRSNDVYKQQETFIKELDNVRRERIKEKINTRPQRVQRVNEI
jgi:putative component of toxin-antitoxin plasmid stabilization module